MQIIENALYITQITHCSITYESYQGNFSLVQKDWNEFRVGMTIPGVGGGKNHISA